MKTLLQVPPKHTVGIAMGLPFFGHLLEISPFSSDLRVVCVSWYGSHGSEILGWCFQGLEVWYNLTCFLICKS